MILTALVHRLDSLWKDCLVESKPFQAELQFLPLSFPPSLLPFLPLFPLFLPCLFFLLSLPPLFLSHLLFLLLRRFWNTRKCFTRGWSLSLLEWKALLFWYRDILCKSQSPPPPALWLPWHIPLRNGEEPDAQGLSLFQSKHLPPGCGFMNGHRIQASYPEFPKIFC